MEMVCTCLIHIGYVWDYILMERLDEREVPKDERGVVITRKHAFTDTWAAMEKIYETTDKVRNIGVSNFSIKK
jgi:diketogulonate reductase-like aldo/keto reductase